MASTITKTDGILMTGRSWTGQTVSLLSLWITGDTAGTTTIDVSNGDPLPVSGLAADSGQINFSNGTLGLAKGED